MSIKRVLVANRGEVAVRVLRACQELGIEAVAVYSTADETSGHVALAERAVCIGPPHAAESYLDIPSLIAAATTTGCDAVHPGWGFLAENSEFARACEDNDLSFIGPRPETIDLMGDKVSARIAMTKADVSGVPGSAGQVDLAQANEQAREVGFPVLLKASAGGGGKGMRLVEDADGLAAAFETASAEAQAAFGNDALYVEKALTNARHVEVQVLCDGVGGVLIVGERECSIQRRHQKLIEEAPSPAVSDALRRDMTETAERACRAIGYQGAGTLEFLVADGDFYFIEMNTRLQVEHPVTELVAGFDLVQAQIAIAGGASISDVRSEPLRARGHAIEVRINAEDPANDFMPAPGLITRFVPPLGPGVRVDTHIYEGYSVPPYYDSLLAKIIVWAEDRPRATARAIRALRELRIEGVPTTAGLAIDILNHPSFREGEYTTTWLEDVVSELPALAQS